MLVDVVLGVVCVLSFHCQIGSDISVTSVDDRGCVVDEDTALLGNSVELRFEGGLSSNWSDGPNIVSTSSADRDFAVVDDVASFVKFKCRIDGCSTSTR